MYHKYLNEKGSFKAWSIGFHYEYDSETNILDIINARSNRPLTYINVQEESPDSVLDFVALVDKVAQLYALNLSTQSSIDLTEILSKHSVKAILNQVIHIAFRAHHLKCNRFKSFSDLINSTLKDQKLLLKRSKYGNSGPSHYSCYLQDKREGNVNKIRETHLHDLLSGVSNYITTHVLADQITSATDNALNETIRLASEISMLSATLNDAFLPAKCIKNTSNINRLQKTS